MSRPKAAELRQGHANNVRPLRPSAPIDLPEPPRSLGAWGRKLWTDIWIAGSTAYQPLTDCHVVERYVSLQERRRDLLELLEKDGWLTEGSTGQLVIHPAAKLLDQIEGRLGPLEDRLGLSPEARLRLGISSVEHKSKLEAFLNKSGGTS